jgi:nitrous oxidase accessory protein NosD
VLCIYLQEDSYVCYGLRACEYPSAVNKEEWIGAPIAETVGVFLYNIHHTKFRHCSILKEEVGVRLMEH